MRNRIIFLSVILIAIVATGIFLLMRDKDHNSMNDISGEDEAFKEDTNDGYVEEENKTQSDSFYYVENFVEEEDWAINEMFLKYEGKIVKVAEDKKIYLKDLENKEDIYEIKNEHIISANGLWIEDNIFWSTKYDSERGAVIVKSFDNEGNEKDNIELKDFKGVIIDNSYIQVKEMKVVGDYIYLLLQTNTQPILQVFTKSGELKISYENVDSFDVNHKGHCVFTTISSEKFPYRGFFMIDATSGDEIFRNTSYELNPVRFSADKKQIYGFDGKVHLFDAESGKFVKTVFEFGKDSTYLLDDYHIKDMMVGKNDEIYFSLGVKTKTEEDFERIGMKTLYYSYTKEKGEQAKRKTTITITAPYRHEFMEEAIKRYELKYLDEHVEYDYAYNTYEEFRKNGEEYGAKLTLDIIQGNIGDIVHTGGSGIESHEVLATDAFMDLTDLINNAENYNDLNKNVLNALKINNAIRGIPINYMFYQYELNEDLEKQLGLDVDFNNISWSEILDLVKIIEKKAPDKHLFTSYIKETSVWEYFGEFILIANMPDLINLKTKEVDLNQQWFKELLIEFKECSKSENFVLSDYEYKLTDRLHGSLLAITLNRDFYYSDTAIHFDEYNKTHKSRMIPNFTGEKNDNRIGYSLRMYSINNRSSRKENAWKFLSFLLEEDIQFLVSRDKTGMPINKKGVDRMIEDATYMHGLSGKNIDKYNKNMIDNSHEIDYLYNMGYLRLDISEPIGLYMDGEMTLDEALKKAEENIIIRLNE